MYFDNIFHLFCVFIHSKDLAGWVPNVHDEVEVPTAGTDEHPACFRVGITFKKRSKNIFCSTKPSEQLIFLFQMKKYDFVFYQVR